MGGGIEATFGKCKKIALISDVFPQSVNELINDKGVCKQPRLHHVC